MTYNPASPPRGYLSRPRMMGLDWRLSSDGQLFPIRRGMQMDSNHPDSTTSGVYVITDPALLAVRVGQARYQSLFERLDDNLRDPKLWWYAGEEILVTWAPVPDSYIDGVERHLGDALKPIYAERFPDVSPVFVNLPGPIQLRRQLIQAMVENRLATETPNRIAKLFGSLPAPQSRLSGLGNANGVSPSVVALARMLSERP